MALVENVEMFVKPKKKHTPIIVSMVLTLACAVVVILLVGIMGMGAFIVIVPVIAVFALLSFLAFSKSRVEFEYSLMAGVLNISRITNQTNRKIIATLDAKEITEFGSITKEKLADEYRNSSGDCKIIDCSDVNEEMYYFKYRDNKNGMMKIIFSPNDRMIDALRLKSSEVMRAVRKI